MTEDGPKLSIFLPFYLLSRFFTIGSWLKNRAIRQKAQFQEELLLAGWRVSLKDAASPLFWIEEMSKSLANDLFANNPLPLMDIKYVPFVYASEPLKLHKIFKLKG
ncbi:MAG: hypothetical protein QW702_07585 [Candidatus Bathyarchaeia archaeon]